MPCTQYSEPNPTSSQTGPAFAQSTRDNLLAVRDMVTMGIMPGWSMATSGGSAAEPAVITYSNTVVTTERLRATVTWSSGNPTTIVYDYSANSGTDWARIGTKTNTFDADGYLTASAMSTS